MATCLDEFYHYTDANELALFSEIATFASSLGYKAKRAKTKDLNIIFTNSKIKQHILKFSVDKGKPILKMKYFASTTYSKLFLDAIRHTIEEYEFRYTGCYKCGKCKSAIEGYIYQYDDGRQYFRCGSELIEILEFTKNDLIEIKRLLEVQHSYFFATNAK